MSNKKHKIKLTEDEMNIILQSISETAFLGKFSEAVSKLKKKMRLKESTDNGEPKSQPVADLVKRLPPRKEK